MTQKPFLPSSYQTQKAHKKQEQKLVSWPTVERSNINDNAKVLLKLFKQFQRSFYDMNSDQYFQWYDPTAISYAHNRNIDAVEGHMETTPEIADEIVKEFIQKGWIQLISVRYTKENSFKFWTRAKKREYGTFQTGLVFKSDVVESDLYQDNQRSLNRLFDL